MDGLEAHVADGVSAVKKRVNVQATRSSCGCSHATVGSDGVIDREGPRDHSARKRAGLVPLGPSLRFHQRGSWVEIRFGLGLLVASGKARQLK